MKNETKPPNNGQIQPEKTVTTPIEFCKLNLPTGKFIPEGYNLIEAYEKDGEIVVPISNIPECKNDLHNCDIEGCGTFSHVVRFTVEEKYKRY